MTATPEEKAKQLVSDFLHLRAYETMNQRERDVAWTIAKGSAKICCQEIINALPKLVAAEGYGNARFDNPDIEFYTNVLNAIDTL